MSRCEADEAIAAGARGDHAVRPATPPRPGADPVAAAHLRGAPAPGAAEGHGPRSRWSSRSGDAREVHHIALLLGYGAAAVNPYLVLESAEDLARQALLADVTPAKAVRNTCTRWARACSR